MNKGRLEAFSDGVFAIIITIMVLELRPPEGNSFADLLPVLLKFISYILSFVYIAIYWNNHHHMFQVVQHVNGRVLWANILLLFCLSLVPFVTAWTGENHFASSPVALYGVVLIMAAISCTILVNSLLHIHGKDSILATSIGSDFKGKISIVIYASGILLSFLNPFVGFALYCLVTCIWFILDMRIEKRIKEEGK
jgi:uncharacterized membrane protein